MLHLETVAASTLELLKELQGLDSLRETRLVGGTAIENIKVDIVNYPYPWIDIKICKENIVLATDKDIAAMKLSAITNRGTKKDFIDLFYLLKSYSLEQMLSFYTEKYSGDSVFMVLKSLTYFDDAEIDISPNVLDLTINWTNIKNTITNEVKQLV